MLIQHEGGPQWTPNPGVAPLRVCLPLSHAQLSPAYRPGTGGLRSGGAVAPAGGHRLPEGSCVPAQSGEHTQQGAGRELCSQPPWSPRAAGRHRLADIGWHAVESVRHAAHRAGWAVGWPRGRPQHHVALWTWGCQPRLPLGLMWPWFLVLGWCCRTSGALTASRGCGNKQVRELASPHPGLGSNHTAHWL